MARILIVDDSLIMRRNLRTILERSGHEVIAEATNGEDAIRLYELHHPDLVTMDITMPILNGIEAVKRISATDDKASIIVISAFDQRNMLFEAMDNGAKHYIIKPITESKLLQAVKLTLASTNSVTPSAEGERSETITVTNVEGRFIIQLPKPLLPEHMNACRVALQGLLFIRPLLLTIDFQDLTDIQPSAVQAIQEMSERIRQADGHLQFIINHTELRRMLMNGIPSIRDQDVNA